MSRTASPLRYPGGKSCMLPLVSQIIRSNGLSLSHYAEPYAGGGGLALGLLYSSVVSDIHLNDIDVAIWSVWKSILDHTEEFVQLVANAKLTIDEWRFQREIYNHADEVSTLELGYSTFYLNRTNRSGIIKSGGVIGGLDQSGSYKMDCRFNKDNLIRRIRRISKYRDRIHITSIDAVNFLKEKDADKSINKIFFCIDPPYFNKGAKLYTSFYRKNDHRLVSEAIRTLSRPWVVTYDDTPEIRAHYLSERKFLFDINYSVQTKRIGTELLIASPELSMPTEMKSRLVA